MSSEIPPPSPDPASALLDSEEKPRRNLLQRLLAYWLRTEKRNYVVRVSVETLGISTLDKRKITIPVNGLFDTGNFGGDCVSPCIAYVLARHGGAEWKKCEEHILEVPGCIAKITHKIGLRLLIEPDTTSLVVPNRFLTLELYVVPGRFWENLNCHIIFGGDTMVKYGIRQKSRLALLLGGAPDQKAFGRMPRKVLAATAVRKEKPDKSKSTGSHP